MLNVLKCTEQPHHEELPGPKCQQHQALGGVHAPRHRLHVWPHDLFWPMEWERMGALFWQKQEVHLCGVVLSPWSF